MACYSVDWVLGALAASPARVPVRGHLSALGVRSCASDRPFLVRGPDAAALGVADPPERPLEGAPAVRGNGVAEA